MQVKIAEIKVGERFRKEFVDIDELAESIKTYGQIEPIVLDENKNLIAGERRLRACLKLKLECIEAICMAELSDLQKKEIELEENIQRKEFTWQEEVNAKKQLHELKQQLHGPAVRGHVGGWTVTDTATSLGEGKSSTARDIELAQGIRAFPELAKEKNKSTAHKKLKQLQEGILNQELAKRIRVSKAVAHPEIINGNCVDVLMKMESCSVDLVLTDPPYGIDVDNAHTFKRMTYKDTNFEDSDFETFDLLDKVFKELYRVLKMDRHMYVFFAIDKYAQILKLLTKHGFEVHPIPLIWDKGSGSYPSQMTSYVHSYEPFLHCFKGNRKLNGTPKDVFQVKRVPPGSKIHPTQKPTELLRDLIGFSTTLGELVLDPFAGSGATIVAAKETQRRAIGVELDPVYYAKIVARLECQEILPEAEQAPTTATQAAATDPDLDIELEDGD